MPETFADAHMEPSHAGGHPTDQERLQHACRELDPPFACVDLDAFDANRETLTARAGDKRIRVASKSLRCRALLARAIDHGDGAYRGVLALTVWEALWLTDHGVRDVVVGYPSVDRRGLRAVVSRASGGTPGEGITLMVDAVEQLELIRQAGAGSTAVIDVCLDADAGLWFLGGRVRVGPRRSPLHTPAEIAAFAREVNARTGLRVAGMMAYEGQIAGVGDRSRRAPA